MSEDTEWLATAEEDGELRFRVGRRGHQVVAEWLGLATLIASRDGREANLVFGDDVTELEREKLTHGAVRIMLWQLSGKLGLHASAIAHGDRALAFVGASGQGKSTLAAAFCAQGATLLADDAVALRVEAAASHVVPTEDRHWLDDASLGALALTGHATARSKSPVRVSRGDIGPVELAGVVELVWSEHASPSLVRVKGAASFARLLPHLCRLLVDSPEHQRAELDQVERLLAAVPFYVLERPRDFGALAETVARLTTDCLSSKVRP